MRSRALLLALALLALALLALVSAPAAAQERPRPRPRIEDIRGARDTTRVAPLPGDTTAPLVTPGDSTAAADGTPRPAAEPDSTMRALMDLEGYAITRYSGSAATFRADSGAVALVGPARIERDGQTITADSMITFDETSAVICGYGSPVLSGEGSPLSSNQICYDTDRQVGMALGARTEFQQNANWFVHGERVFTAGGGDRIYSAHTEFTSCDLEIPHYHFTASRFKMVTDQILVARDVTLSFGDVPVFWLPFLVQNLTQGRRSGLLTPSLGLADVVQTSDGHTREVRNIGFFWAINDYTGSEVAMDWRSQDWIALRGRFDYRWMRQFLEGYINAQQYFRDTGREFALRSDNAWEPGERTSIRVGGAYASSNSFVRRETFDPAELNRTLQSDASLSHRFRNGASLSLGASRDQQIMADRVTTLLPRVGLNLPSLTLGAPIINDMPQEITWTISGLSYSNTEDDRNETGSVVASDRDSRRQAASAGSSLRFGNLTFSQGVNAGDERILAKPPVALSDTTDSTTAALPEEVTRQLSWNSSLSYRQDLIGSLRITPQLSVNGQFLQAPRTGDEMVQSPVALNFGASAEAEIYGFWPGVGPFERFRHKISPGISYNFRPSPNGTELQDSIFGASTRATNAISLQFSQTFEAKRPAEEGADSAGAPASDDQVVTGDEPRRMSGQTPIRVLSITTSALAYDFEAASRGDHGFTTTEISNTIASDLLQGLSLNMSHSLFDAPVASSPTSGPRSFDLHLETLSTSFGLSGESWLFRVLGLGSESTPETPEEAALDSADTESIIPRDERGGLVPGSSPSRGARGMDAVGSRGTWRADFDYSLRRPRDTTVGAENQQVNGRFAFQPTENWSVGWSTGYSITDSEFLNHSITLTRALHEWQADFRIQRAQNGNFRFEFEARLNDLPDLRVPYDQRSRADDD